MTNLPNIYQNIVQSFTRMPPDPETAAEFHGKIMNTCIQNQLHFDVKCALISPSSRNRKEVRNGTLNDSREL